MISQIFLIWGWTLMSDVRSALSGTGYDTLITSTCLDSMKSLCFSDLVVGFYGCFSHRFLALFMSGCSPKRQTVLNPKEATTFWSSETLIGTISSWCREPTWLDCFYVVRSLLFIFEVNRVTQRLTHVFPEKIGANQAMFQPEEAIGHDSVWLGGLMTIVGFFIRYKFFRQLYAFFFIKRSGLKTPIL